MLKLEKVIVCGLVVVLALECLHREGIPHVPESEPVWVHVLDSAGFSTSADSGLLT
jgi:hypothetical protein